MFTVKNNSNQPLTIGDKSLGVEGSLTVRTIDAEIERLAKRGYVSVIEPAAKDPKANQTKGDEK